MEANLEDIIKEIGKEYGHEDKRLNGIIEKLDEEFYKKLKDMENISEDDWKSLKLPKNLYHLIKKKYELSLNEEKNNLLISQSLNSIRSDYSSIYSVSLYSKNGRYNI